MKEELKSLTVSQLRERAKELGISGRWEMTKAQLIDAIEKSQPKIESEKTNESRESSDMVIGEIRDYDKSKRMKFVENVSVGSIVAFRCFGGKVKSAKVIDKEEDKKKLILETNYGRTFRVSYEDILWVRMGSRWPKGIIQLLKADVIKN